MNVVYAHWQAKRENQVKQRLARNKGCVENEDVRWTKMKPTYVEDVGLN
jgi:hypothetical protein